jgi:hypothetical protein
MSIKDNNKLNFANKDLNLDKHKSLK